jgi:hypothetical protein
MTAQNSSHPLLTAKAVTKLATPVFLTPSGRQLAAINFTISDDFSLLARAFGRRKMMIFL